MDKQFSEEEAQRIFALAAERQQQSHKNREAKLDLKDLEEAGLAAGIDPQFIHEAAADLMRPERIPVYQTVLGTPALIRRSKFFPGQKASNIWDNLLAQVQERFGKQGESSVSAGVYRWKSDEDDKKWPIKLIVEEEKEGARVTIERDRVSQIRGNYVGALWFMIMALVVTIMGLTSGEGTEWIGGLFFGLSALGLAGGTWIGYSIQGRKELAEFNRLIESIPQIEPEAEEKEKTKEQPSITLEVPVDESASEWESDSGRERKKVQ